MRRISAAIFFFLIASSAISQQAWLSKPLQQAVSNPDQTPVEVMVYMKDKVNLDSMLHAFRTHKTKLSVRAKTTLHALMQKANTTQAEAIAFLTVYGNQFPGSVERVESYWIANVMVVKMAPNLVPELQNLPSIERMELCSEQTLKPVESMKPIASEPKSVGGHEIGLEVIKSTALWAMGYTGHGRLMYSVDTGSWPQHPAIGNRFKGNFFPIDQAWYAFDSPIPADKSDSHGTHILGTTLGLDTTTHDTIGSAFNAYWIATDPIVEDLALIKPMSQLLLAFQWGLNPDGDTATTDDIPDAINNSWGIALTPGADTLCHSLASDMFMAVEAVGTAAIFAAGNEGPDTLTVGRPAFISNSEVDIFSVGALNGNSPDYTIASFSSRGPSVCGGTGSLLIKPEVSAPGVNVRSSIGQNGYSQYSGTSMASPHVTGAVLLLKEAFPYLAGEEIKRALYFTATDMGVAGEDNVYGMGLINVEAAFNYLSQSYVPVPPDARTYDAAIMQVAHPANGSVYCDGSLTPQVVLKNLGDSTINQAYIYYGQVGGQVYTFEWVGQLASGESETVALPAMALNQYGPIELSFRVELTGNFMEYDLVNNRRMSRFNRSNSLSLPFFEGFEQGIDPEVWYKQNPDGDKTWDTVSTDGLLFSSRSATMECGVSVTNNRKDGLISPSFDMSAANDSLRLKFSVAYKFRSASLGDTLSVWVSTDCGASFPTMVYKKGGDELKTVEGHEANFFPDSAGQWREELIDLSAFAGQPSVMFNFVARNRRGNNITLDNIWLYNGLQPIGLNELEQPEAMVFPNPGAEAVRIEAKGLSPGKVLVELVDLTGKCWNKKEMECYGSKLNLNWELGQVPTGVYFIGIKAQNGSRWLKWVRE